MKRTFTTAAMAVVQVFCAVVSHGAKTFTNASGNDWNTTANWTGNTLPVAGDDVIINGNVTQTNSTPALNSYVLSATWTHTMDGWGTTLLAQTVSVTGTLTHAQNSAVATNSLGVWVPNAKVHVVCSNLTVASGGKIDANTKGFLGGKTTYAAGFGPGGAVYGSYNGGSYGGRGGVGNPGTQSKPVYGASQTPGDWPGSGGAGGDNVGRYGGNGGGVVVIEATGVVTVSGSISANGESANNIHGGGGSGGGVAITCRRIEGAGTVSAAGGAGLTWGGGGGGGRLAVAYNAAEMQAAALPTLVFSAAGGLGGQWNGVPFDPKPGTLWFPDDQFISRLGDGVFRHSGSWVQSGVTQWTLPSLKLENAWLDFADGGFALNVTGDISVKGTQPRIHKIATTNATIVCGGNVSLDKGKIEMFAGVQGYPVVDIVGSVSMVNAAVMDLRGYPAVTVDGAMSLADASVLDIRLGADSAPAPGYEGVVTVGGLMSLAGNSLVYPHSHPVNGGTVLFDVGSLNVAKGSQFNAKGKGYWGGKKHTQPGNGPGAGLAYMGGGYGGTGGRNNGVNGMTYGTAEAPIEPGSGGGAADDNARTGGNGGGAIRIKTLGAVVVDGVLQADGDNGVGTHAAGGSGGAIFIECLTFAGSGLLSANGGLGQGLWGGGGGGGRISVVYDTAAQAGVSGVTAKFEAIQGSAPAEMYLGTPGTLHLPDTKLLVQPNGNMVHGGNFVIPGFTSWNLDRLVVSNSYLRVPDNFVVNVTNALVITGTNAFRNRLVVSNGVLNSGSLTMHGKASFDVHGGLTDGLPGSYAGLVNVAGEMRIGKDSWISPYSNPTNGGSPKFMAGSLVIDAGGGFDAIGKGYRGGAGSSDGFGPGRGGWLNGTPFSVNSRGGGAGYGGFGSQYTPVYGRKYGSSTAPTQPGSGGAGGDAPARLGGNGGGLVWLEVSGDATVNGSILADGTACGEEGGSGSGGGVFLTCHTLAGTTGRVSASGVNSTAKRVSGGAGGRISVVYDTAAQSALPLPGIIYTAVGGCSRDVSSKIVGYGDLGTLYFSDNQFLTRTDTIKHGGMWVRDDFPGWTVPQLTFDNSQLSFRSASTPVSLSGNLTVKGTDATAHVLTLSNSVLTCQGNILLNGGGLVLYPGTNTLATLSCAGNLALTNGGALHVSGGIAHPPFGYGAYVNVTGDVSIAANSWIYPYSHPTNGGSPLFTMQNLYISQANGGFDASGRGYMGGAAYAHGYGPGRGGHVRNIVLGMDGGGAGYGGRGGGYDIIGGNPFGETNGLVYAPAGAGSGGGGGVGPAYGGRGGGAINIHARVRADIRGSLLANGFPGGGGNSGGGSGGGIWVRAFKLSGTNAILKAEGGAGGGDMSGGGGGGRIALWHDVWERDYNRVMGGDTKYSSMSGQYDKFHYTTASVLNGADKVKTQYTPPRSQPGTFVFFTVLPPPATLMVIR